MRDDFTQALRDVKLMEKEFGERMGKIEHFSQESLYLNQVNQSDLFKKMENKVS